MVYFFKHWKKKHATHISTINCFLLRKSTVLTYVSVFQMRNQSYLILIVSLFQLFTLSSSLYFHISETERKCFIEEIPDETLVIGKYKVELFDERTNTYLPSTPGIGMHVEVKDPEDKIVLSKLYTSEGRFSFTSHIPGEHVICLYSNSTAWFGGQKLVNILDTKYNTLFSLCSVFILILILVSTPLIINKSVQKKN